MTIDCLVGADLSVEDPDVASELLVRENRLVLWGISRPCRVRKVGFRKRTLNWAFEWRRWDLNPRTS